MCKVSSSVHFVTRSLGGTREGSARAHWVPNTDVYATENGVVVKVELAGMRSEHLEITVEGTRLRISGNRPDGCRSPKCNFLAMEIGKQTFFELRQIIRGVCGSQMACPEAVAGILRDLEGSCQCQRPSPGQRPGLTGQCQCGGGPCASLKSSAP